MSNAKYLGIDLGTSNSAVAIFDAGNVTSILSPLGDINTPSVVRVTNSGIVVGSKAQRSLYSDPKNTYKEFKRLMGTESVSAADLNNKCWKADELSAEVLKSLKSLVETETGYTFNKAVVTVPALFELPQSNATANAARLASFTQVELLPEPVASGLAAGWNSSEPGAWLVYDLGGGTFDVSLMESRDGLLRIVGHDGDNFLGGRDIDRAIVDWLVEQIAAQHQVFFDKKHSDYARALRQLQSAAEKAKIRLSSIEQSIIELDFEYDGEELQEDIPFSRAQLTELSMPMVQRSIEICHRLLTSHGIDRSQLGRVVLVGGPAHMPIIKQAVEEQLAPLAETNIDPMALVSRGAAIYAATINLDCYETERAQRASTRPDYQVWLQYPSVCTELNPTIMGRLVDDECQAVKIQICCPNKSWEGPLLDVDSDIFIGDVQIQPGQTSSFILKAFDRKHKPITLRHQAITIVHGLTMSDPPLARSIGVALADGTVKTFIDRGTPLPAKRTFVQNCVTTLVPGSGQTIFIPIVQGERRKVRFCRKVGNLEINSDELKRSIQVGSPIEITIEVDRGGDLKAQAYLADQGKIIEGVANLVIADASPASLQASYQGLNTRITSRFHEAFRDRNELLIARLEPLSKQMQLLQRDMQQLDGDVDLAQRVLRNLLEIESEIDHIENQDQMAELAEECEQTYFRAADLVRNYGDSADQRILEDCARHLENVLKLARQGEMERLIERLESLCQSAHKKSPDFWRDAFYYWASFVQQANNPKRAQALITKGRKAIEKNDVKQLKSITNDIYSLIPEQLRNNGEQNYDSGIY